MRKEDLLYTALYFLIPCIGVLTGVLIASLIPMV